MRKYFITPNFAIAINAKVGCSSVARSVISAFYPEIEQRLQNAYFPVGRNPDNMQWQSQVPKTDEPSSPTVLLVRDPVERFRSACAQVGVSVEDALASLETGDPISTHSPVARSLVDNVHFFLQSDYLHPEGTRCYLFPDHLEAFANDCGLGYPLPTINEAADKPVLTDLQTERVREYYSDDLELFNRIAVPGQVELPVPPETIPAPAPTFTDGEKRYNAALQAIGLPPGSTGDEIMAKLNTLPADEVPMYALSILASTVSVLEDTIGHPIATTIQRKIAEGAEIG